MLNRQIFDYENHYAVDTYGETLEDRFQKIVELSPEESDNVQRADWIESKLLDLGLLMDSFKLLDIGSGLGVFPYEMTCRGWNTVAIEPSMDFYNHLQNLGLADVRHGFFVPGVEVEKYQLITLNKVLEHIDDPKKLLYELTLNLSRNGALYVEVPDGEAAIAVGQDREEFFVEHLHVFTRLSVNQTLESTGFQIVREETLREPSGKFTLRTLAKAR